MKDSLLSTTMELAGRFRMSPFAVLREDADEVISFINCLICMAPPDGSDGRVPEGEQRKKVNDKTATGGWF